MDIAIMLSIKQDELDLHANQVSFVASQQSQFILTRNCIGKGSQIPIEIFGINPNCGLFSEAEVDSFYQGWIYNLSNLVRGYFDENLSIYQTFYSVRMRADFGNPNEPLNQLRDYAPCLSKVVCGLNSNPSGREQYHNMNYLQLPGNVQDFQIISHYFNPDTILATGLPRGMDMLPVLTKVTIDGIYLLNLPDWKALQALERVEIVYQYALNRYLEGVSQSQALKSLKLGYADAATETLNIPASFADLADTLQELDLLNCRVTDPTERQRIQSLLPNTTIIW